MRLSAGRILSFCIISSKSFDLKSTNLRLFLRNMSGGKSLPTSDAGWRTVLSPMQFKVLREKGTEPPGYSEKTIGELEYTLKKEHGTKCPTEGVFNCAACSTPLYKATSKFDSGCGWPAFYEGVPGAIKEVSDADGRRVEILCQNCGSHLGHVFKGEGFPTPTNERYVLFFHYINNIIKISSILSFFFYRHCVNGICLKYTPSV